MATLPRSTPAGNAGPETVRALIGPQPCDGDPAGAFDIPGLPTHEFELVAALVEVSPDLLEPLAVTTAEAPPPVAPFPEPPAGVTLAMYDFDLELLAIFRAAWPHLSADQRAEAARRVEISSRHTQRRLDDAVAEAARGREPVSPLQRDWRAFHVQVEAAAELVDAHARGWVAEAARQADPHDDAWPHDVPEMLAAAGWVLANIDSILTGEVGSEWEDAPHNRVFELAPMPDPDPSLLPADADGRRDKLAALVAVLNDVNEDLDRCLDQQHRLRETHPLRETLLDGLGGGLLALAAVTSNLRSDLYSEVEAADAWRRVAGLRIAKRTREAEAAHSPD